MSGCRSVRVVGVPAVRKAVLPGVFATVSVLALTLTLSPPATAAYGLEGAGAASGRAGTLIRPDGLVWTLADGSCVGQNLPGGIVRTDSRITFTPPQPGVTYQVRKVVKGDHPDGNYHPVGIVATLSGPVVNRPLAPQTADPRLEYLFVQAKVGNWVSNSHVVGCTPTKPGVVKEEPPVVIPIWGLPGYRGARTPDNPNPVTPPPALPTPGRSGV
ncbi:MAG TPA: hypothetical protein VGL64_11945 [Amycolatopsis sp.]